jgi:hypothetical protein
MEIPEIRDREALLDFVRRGGRATPAWATLAAARAPAARTSGRSPGSATDRADFQESGSMAFRKPRSLAGGGELDVLQYEIMQEKAAVLARLGRKLQAALDALAAFDAAALARVDAGERDALVAAAGEALWYFVVQREVLGIPDTEGMMRQLGVPREVRLRMGLNRRPADR